MYPGSFNPLHAAHQWVIGACKPVLEISVNRRGKGYLTLDDLMARCEQIASIYPDQVIAITNSMFFKEKIRTFGTDIVFCIGTDTLRRLIEDDRLENVEAMKCFFAVFQRDNDQPDTIQLPINSKFFRVPECVRYESSSRIRAEKEVSYVHRIHSETQAQIDEHEFIDLENE